METEEDKKGKHPDRNTNTHKYLKTNRGKNHRAEIKITVESVFVATRKL